MKYFHLVLPYLKLMRLHKPIGILLLLWPTMWALWLAAGGFPDYKVLTIFISGVILMRSAGCIINDIADRHIDKHIKRTQMRPITSGELSVQSAFILFFILILFAFVLVLQLNWMTIQLSFIALFFACLYPFTKRFTFWPQLFLGIAFAMAVPIAYAAINHFIPAKAWLVFSIAVLWPFMYDTQYAMADKSEDLKIGVKSSAIALGRWDILGVLLTQFIIIGLLFLLGYLEKLSWVYFVAVILSAVLFVYQLFLIRDRNPSNCFRAFLNNQWVGAVIFLGIVLS